MSIGSSPARTPTVFGREYDVEGGFDSDFSTEIQKKMTVPKSIHVGSASDSSDIEDNWSRMNSGQADKDKLRMQVPDRILVRGQEKHVGTSTVPREIQLDSAIMPPDPEMIRIQTPPRSITLFESSNKVKPNGHDHSHPRSPRSPEGDDETLVVEGDSARFITPIPNGPMRSMGIADSFYIRNREGSVGPGGEVEDLQNDVYLLQNQLRKMNSRVISIENEMSERKDRETYIIAAGLLYIAIQAFTWIFRSQHNR